MNKYTDQIRVQGIPCFTKIGVADNERVIGQRLLIDIEAFVDHHKAGESDQLEDTISYVVLEKAVYDVTQARDYKLIEHLSSVICNKLFSQFSKILAIQIRIHKPHIPDASFNGQASVSIFRERP
jgi:dihydroneopterin aldolase